MRRIIVVLILLFVAVVSFGKDGSQSKQRGGITGFDGGMMIHTGYLRGDISSINYSASGAPFGIGGVIRLHLGKNWRVGSEGYMSKLAQMDNGSNIKYFWAGLLADYRLHFGDFALYGGLTLGAGTITHLLMFEEPTTDWAPIDGTIFQKNPFWAVDPFIGGEYALSDAMRLTIKADYLRAISEHSANIPMGPRIYIGFIFSH